MSDAKHKSEAADAHLKNTGTTNVAPSKPRDSASKAWTNKLSAYDRVDVAAQKVITKAGKLLHKSVKAVGGNPPPVGGSPYEWGPVKPHQVPYERGSRPRSR